MWVERYTVHTACMYVYCTCTVDGLTLKIQVLTPTPTAAGDPETPSSNTTATRSGTTFIRSDTISSPSPEPAHRKIEG